MSKLPTQHLTKCALTYIAEEAKLLPRNLRSKFVFLDSSMVERTAVNRDVVGSSPTRGASLYGSMVKRLRHRPFTAVTRVRFPLESLIFGDIAKR